MTKRTVSVSHLVVGLVLLGAAGLWAVGAGTDADAPDLAMIAPAVLTAAGVAGLIALLFNARNARIEAARTGEEAGTVEHTVDAEPLTTDTDTDHPYADSGATDPKDLS